MLLLTLYHQSKPLTTLKKKAFENNVGKGEIAGYKHVLLFPTFFLYFSYKKFQDFSHIYFVVCKCFQVGVV